MRDRCLCPRGYVDPHKANPDHTPVHEGGELTGAEQLDLLDKRIDEVFYRSSLHRDECAKVFAGLPVDWEPRREYQTRTEVVDMLLDARSSLMTEERTDESEEMNGELQEELDALLGADLNAG